MRAIMSGIAAAIVLGVIAAIVLSMNQKTVYEVYTSSSTRVGDPGDNLVGKTWSGDPSIRDMSRSASAESGSSSQ
jgi:hypothetical protein